MSTETTKPFSLDCVVDKRLSWEAKGVMVYALIAKQTCPDEPYITIYQITADCDWTKEKAQQVIQELVDAGYLYASPQNWTVL